MTPAIGPILFEACAESAPGAVVAQDGGAGRVELCADLPVGGTTPSPAAIRAARRSLSVPLHVLIRPRAGDALYTASEMDILREDVRHVKHLGADGVVLGVLKAGGAVDRDRTADLIERARPMSVTFHRAFDACYDADEALDVLIGLGVDRVLTSGRAVSALAGAGRIASLVRRAAGRLIVVAGGGISPANVAQIVARTGVSEVHGSALGELGVISAASVRAIVAGLRTLSHRTGDSLPRRQQAGGGRQEDG